MHVRGIGRFTRARKRKIHDLRPSLRVCKVAEESRDRNIPVERRFGAYGRVSCRDRLPGLLSVVRALVHVPPADPVGDEREPVVKDPERGTEAVRDASDALTRKRIAFAYDEGRSGDKSCRREGLNGSRGVEKASDGT